MTRRLALCLALVLASCASPRGVPVPDPRPEPAAPPPAPPPRAQPKAPPAGTDRRIARDTVLTDSIVLASHARDSALDAAMLERLAVAEPPDAGAPASASAEPDAAALREMFDIDVANWVEKGRVRYYLGFFTGLARERMAIWLQRLPRYEPVIRQQLVARGLPGDLAYLPLIESGYSATAVSRSRAVGMWQFMRGTARLYGLRVDGWVDERRDVPKATDAAIRFLSDLTVKFGSPYLAAAAYNGGPGRIQRGLARIDVGEDEEPDDSTGGAPTAGDAAFFQLADTRYIRRETKDYVPKLIAAAMIAKQPARYGFPPPAAVPAPASDSVIVPDATGLEVIARAAGMSLAGLRELNPQFLHPVTPPDRRSVVRLPAGTGAATRASLDSLPAGDRIPAIAHNTRKGETLARIGDRYGVGVEELRRLNPALRSRPPRRGEAVLVPGRAQLRVWLAESRRAEAAQRARAKGRVHRVRSGETLRSIAARYGLTPEQLLSWNGLKSAAGVRAGQTLRLAAPRPAKGTGRSTRLASDPGSRVHVVKKGETLTSLARTCGSSAEDLRSANGLPAGRPLFAGQRITIPC